MNMYTKDPLGYKRRLKKKSKRPLPITVLCVLIVLLGIWNLISMYINVYKGVYAIYPAANALMIVFSFVSISGIWSMEKWGAITFPVVVTIKIIIDLIFSVFSGWYLLGYVVAIYIFTFYKQMRRSE
jgi:hypothetical protein